MKEMEGLSEVIKDLDKIDMERLIFASHNAPLSTQVSIKWLKLLHKVSQIMAEESAQVALLEVV